MGQVLSGDLQDEVTGISKLVRAENPVTSRNLIPAQKDLDKETVDGIKKKYLEDIGNGEEVEEDEVVKVETEVETLEEGHDLPKEAPVKKKATKKRSKKK